MNVPAPAREITRRLPRDARRRQLLEVSRTIVRENGTDRLTLGYLAQRARVSKPVVYDHFATPAALLIELYRWLDGEIIAAFRATMAVGERSRSETIAALAAAYIDCASDTDGEVQAVGRALAGSAEKAAVFEELLDEAVAMFVAVLTPHTRVPADELARRCVGLVGAGEALAAKVVRGDDRSHAIASLTALIDGAA